MLTPTKSKPIVFDIDMKENMNMNNKTPSKTSMQVKERLEKRKIMNLNSEEKMSMLNANLSSAEKRRQANIQTKLMKVHNELEKVKQAKAKV